MVAGRAIVYDAGVPKSALLRCSATVPLWGRVRGEGNEVTIYPLSARVVFRTDSCSSVVASAYRAGKRLVNEWTGLVHDYTTKRGVEA
jgi:hypothetical protein